MYGGPRRLWLPARSLRKNLGLTCVAIVTLGLGIGFNTAIYSVVNAFLLRPLPVRDPVQLYFEWYGDLLLHFLRRVPWPLRNDLGVRVGHVGVRFYGQAMKRDDSPNKQNDRDAKDQDAVAKSELNEIANHFFRSAIAVENSRALSTIS